MLRLEPSRRIRLGRREAKVKGSGEAAGNKCSGQIGTMPSLNRSSDAHSASRHLNGRFVLCRNLRLQSIALKDEGAGAPKPRTVGSSDNAVDQVLCPLCASGKLSSRAAALM